MTAWSPSAAREQARADLAALLADEGDSPPICYEQRVAALRRMLKEDLCFDTLEAFYEAMKEAGND